MEDIERQIEARNNTETKEQEGQDIGGADRSPSSSTKDFVGEASRQSGRNAPPAYNSTQGAESAKSRRELDLQKRSAESAPPKEETPNTPASPSIMDSVSEYTDKLAPYEEEAADKIDKFVTGAVDETEAYIENNLKQYLPDEETRQAIKTHFLMTADPIMNVISNAFEGAGIENNIDDWALTPLAWEEIKTNETDTYENRWMSEVLGDMALSLIPGPAMAKTPFTAYKWTKRASNGLRIAAPIVLKAESQKTLDDETYYDANLELTGNKNVDVYINETMGLVMAYLGIKGMKKAGGKIFGKKVAKVTPEIDITPSQKETVVQAIKEQEVTLPPKEALKGRAKAVEAKMKTEVIEDIEELVMENVRKGPKKPPTSPKGAKAVLDEGNSQAEILTISTAVTRAIKKPTVESLEAAAESINTFVGSFSRSNAEKVLKRKQELAGFSPEDVMKAPEDRIYGEGIKKLEEMFNTVYVEFSEIAAGTGPLANSAQRLIKETYDMASLRVSLAGADMRYWRDFGQPRFLKMMEITTNINIQNKELSALKESLEFLTDPSLRKQAMKDIKDIESTLKRAKKSLKTVGKQPKDLKVNTGGGLDKYGHLRTAGVVATRATMNTMLVAGSLINVGVGSISMIGQELLTHSIKSIGKKGFIWNNAAAIGGTVRNTILSIPHLFLDKTARGNIAKAFKGSLDIMDKTAQGQSGKMKRWGQLVDTMSSAITSVGLVTGDELVSFIGKPVAVKNALIVLRDQLLEEGVRAKDVALRLANLQKGKGSPRDTERLRVMVQDKLNTYALRNSNEELAGTIGNVGLVEGVGNTVLKLSMEANASGFFEGVMPNYFIRSIVSANRFMARNTIVGADKLIQKGVTSSAKKEFVRNNISTATIAGLVYYGGELLGDSKVINSYGKRDFLGIDEGLLVTTKDGGEFMIPYQAGGAALDQLRVLGSFAQGAKLWGSSYSTGAKVEATLAEIATGLANNKVVSPLFQAILRADRISVTKMEQNLNSSLPFYAEYKRFDAATNKLGTLKVYDMFGDPYGGTSDVDMDMHSGEEGFKILSFLGPGKNWNRKYYKLNTLFARVGASGEQPYTSPSGKVYGLEKLPKNLAFELPYARNTAPLGNGRYYDLNLEEVNDAMSLINMSKEDQLKWYQKKQDLMPIVNQDMKDSTRVDAYVMGLQQKISARMNAIRDGEPIREAMYKVYGIKEGQNFKSWINDVLVNRGESDLTKTNITFRDVYNVTKEGIREDLYHLRRSGPDLSTMDDKEYEEFLDDSARFYIVKTAWAAMNKFVREEAVNYNETYLKEAFGENSFE